MIWNEIQCVAILATMACTGRLFLHWQGVLPRDASSWPVSLVFGQLLFLLYAFFRVASVSIGAPSLSTLELWLLALPGLVWTGWSRPVFRRGRFLLAALVVLCALLALRLSDLGTLSSDPDLHAYQARAMLQSGGFAAFYPQGVIPDRYPGGFRVLNLLWGRFFGWDAVKLVNAQPYIQAFIMVLGALFLFARGLPRSKAGIYLGLGIFTALFVYLPVWGEQRQNNEGTARLAANGVLLIPLFTFWLGRRRRAPIFFALAGMVLPLAVAFNPALILPLLILSIAAFFFLRPPRRSMVAFVLGAAGFGLLCLVTDPFLSSWGKIGLNQAAQPTQPLPPVTLADWLFLPIACVVGTFGASVLAVSSWSYVSGVVAGWTCWRMKPGPVILTWFRIWAVFLFGSQAAIELLRLLIPRASLGSYLFYQYTEATAQQIALVFAGVFMPFLLLSVRRLRGGWILFSILLLGLLLRSEVDLRINLKAMMRTTLGEVTPDAVALVRDAESLVANGERVLLSCRVTEAPWELWVMPEGASRAVGLYSNLQTAFYFGVDHPDFKAGNYRAHVEKQLNLDWLKARGVRWAVVEGEDPRFPKKFKTALQRGKVRLVEIE